MTDGDRFLRLRDVSKKTGLARSTIYKYMAQGFFPKSVILGPRAIGWSEKTIDAWMEERLCVQQ